MHFANRDNLGGAPETGNVIIAIRKCITLLHFSRCLITLGTDEFQGHHTNQAYYKSGILSPGYPIPPPHHNCLATANFIERQISCVTSGDGVILRLQYIQR